MTQQAQAVSNLKQHSIWQDGRKPDPCAIVIFGGTGGNRLFYLATPPDADPDIIAHLKEAGLARPAHNSQNGHQSWTHIIIEKPFGHDLPSAQKLNRELARVFNEKQIYRIDHYMG